MSIIRLIYLYLFAAVGLITIIVRTVGMVNLGLRTYVFRDADKMEVYPTKPLEGQPAISDTELQARQDRDVTRNRQREFVGALAMLLVGTPVYLYHWKTIQTENKKK